MGRCRDVSDGTSAAARLRGMRMVTRANCGGWGSAPFAALLGWVLGAVLVGCTVYPEQKTPSLAMTTSAEHVDRIFWQNVAAGKWTEVNSLLAPNAVWRVEGRIVPRAQIVPWLQGLNIRAVQVTEVTLTPAVNDMNVVSTVQVEADHAIAVVTQGNAPASGICAGRPQTLHALAVWQQPQPKEDAAKDKGYRGYLLTVHDLTRGREAGVASDAACQ
jgi:hypothetical protein